MHPVRFADAGREKSRRDDCLGKHNKVISFELEVSEQAVKNWRSSIFHKLNCKNIVELNAFSVRFIFLRTNDPMFRRDFLLTT
ncbi:MAG: LuxR C-terminal-related transcriptional regulator [Parasutterella sp.]